MIYKTILVLLLLAMCVFMQYQRNYEAISTFHDVWSAHKCGFSCRDDNDERYYDEGTSSSTHHDCKHVCNCDTCHCQNLHRFSPVLNPVCNFFEVFYNYLYASTNETNNGFMTSGRSNHTSYKERSSLSLDSSKSEAARSKFNKSLKLRSSFTKLIGRKGKGQPKNKLDNSEISINVADKGEGCPQCVAKGKVCLKGCPARDKSKHNESN